MQLQMLSQQRKILLFVLVITSGTCQTLAIELDLNDSCSGSQTYYCVLDNLNSSLDEPLILMTNSTAEQLNELIIHNSILGRLPFVIFEIAPKLHTLIIQNCAVNRILPTDFNKATQLHKLFLQKNRLFNIPERVFAGMYALEELYLPYNTIHMIHRYAFSGLGKLRHLDLQKNGIRLLPPSVFDDLINLEYIDLSNNEIESINAETFSKNSKLNTLLLSDNKFSVFEANSLMNFKHLNTLDLSNTLLEEISLASVDLLMLQNSGLKKCIISGGVIKLNAANNELKDITIKDKLSARELDLHGNLFESLEDLIGMENLQRLDMSKNQLTSLRTSHSPMYLPLPNLVTLNLASNILKNLTLENFILMSKLKYLDLAFNHLIRLEADIFEPLISLEKFYVEGNRLTVFDYLSLKRSHSLLHEMGIFENDWEFRYLKRMLTYLRGHDIRLPMRFTPSDSLNNNNAEATESFAMSKSPLGHHATDDVDILTDMSHARQSVAVDMDRHLTETHQQQQQSLIGVTGIHPYWTTRDILALLTLIVVLLILLIQFFRILQEENCMPFCCRRCFNIGNPETEPIRPRHRPLVEDSSDV